MGSQDVNNSSLKELYAEFEDEDHRLAETDLADYVESLTLEDLLESVTEESIHSEIPFGLPVGKEVW